MSWNLQRCRGGRYPDKYRKGLLLTKLKEGERWLEVWRITQYGIRCRGWRILLLGDTYSIIFSLFSIDNRTILISSVLLSHFCIFINSYYVVIWFGRDRFRAYRIVLCHNSYFYIVLNPAYLIEFGTTALVLKESTSITKIILM